MNKLLTSVMALFLSTATMAQVRIGVVAGAQRSTIQAGVDLTALSPLIGELTIPVYQRVAFRAGVMAEQPISDNLSLRGQLLYSVKGGNADVGKLVTDLLARFAPTLPPLDNQPLSRLAINYLELPVELLYGFKAGPGRLLIGAGPYVALAIGGSINGEAINFNTENFRKTDIGATASLGYELPMRLLISAYYSHGFSNIAKSATPNLGSINPGNPTIPSDPSAFGGTLRNRAYGLTLGYFLNRRD